MILRRLSTGDVAQLDVADGADGATKLVVETARAGTRVRVGGSSHGEPVETEPEVEPKAEPKAEPKKRAPAADPKKRASASESKSKARSAPAKKRGKPSVQDDVELDPSATEPTGASPESDPQPAEETAAPAQDGLPPELVGAKQLRHIVSYFYDNGIATTVDAIVERCAEHQADVPVLARIKNLEDRVRRACSVLDIQG